jgi:LAO/AO transport system kinase
LTKDNNYFFEKRKEQNQYWMMETIIEALKINFFQHPEIVALLEANKKAVANNEISPFAAAQIILKAYWSKK